MGLYVENLAAESHCRFRTEDGTATLARKTGFRQLFAFSIASNLLLGITDLDERRSGSSESLVRLGKDEHGQTIEEIHERALLKDTKRLSLGTLP